MLSFNEIMANVQSEYFSYFEKIHPIQISSLDQKINLDGSTHDLEASLSITDDGLIKKTIIIPLAFQRRSQSSSIIDSPSGTSFSSSQDQSSSSTQY